MTAPLTVEQIRDADNYLDGEEQHNLFAALGRRLFEAFGEDPQGRDRVSSQVRSLQQVAVSATRFADVEDFVKNQMGKATRSAQDWRKVGDEVLKQLARLRDSADRLATDEHQRLQVRLHLARGWVRAVVGEYLYAKAQKEMERSHA